MKKFTSILFISLSYLSIQAQESLLNSFDYRTVGPFRGGRVTAVAGTAMQENTFYMGATGGGVWKTKDYGITWKNVSDGYFSTPSIGAIRIAANDPNIVYVGTGSDGIRSNVILGKGVYKSIDAGETWQHLGLEEVGQIGAMEINPMNHNIVYIAAQGNPFRPSAERGIFKTVDGGRSWEKVLYISDSVGFADVELLPGNPEIVFAAAWKNERKPWTIKSGGKSSDGGIFKSVDGGKTWDKISQGLPEPLIGKIDLALTPADSRIVYALVEAPGKQGGLYKSIDQGESFTLISNNRGIRTRPFYYTNVKVDPQNPDRVYVLATGYYRSDDGGKNWNRISSPHGDNHDLWINPENPHIMIQSNDGGANVSMNGGETWSTQFNQPTVEVYQVEVDDAHPYWLYGGQQDNYTTVSVPSLAPYGVQDPEIGLLINTGGCETGPAVPKPGNPNIVYSNCKGRFSVYDKRTGLERSYDVGASFMYGHNPKDLRYRFQRVSPIHVSPHNPEVIYHTSQYVHKTTDEGKTWTTISPDLTAFEEDKQVISGSPITRDITGEEFYSTIYSIRESPLQEGLIWVGSNDGPVHVTRDGGSSWNKVTPPVEPGGRVDAVDPSHHKPGKAIVSILRYQLGDERPYIFKTEDFGKKWSLISDPKSGFPQDVPVRVVREDPVREGLLFAGTEYGLYISGDNGQSWLPFQQNLPVTPITDIKIFRDDLVLSTMGRGFWILDKINALRDPVFWAKEKEDHLFQPADTYKYLYPKMRGGYHPRPSVIVDYYIAEESGGVVELIISSANGELIQYYTSDDLLSDTIANESRNMATNQIRYIIEEKLKKNAGLHRFNWDMTGLGPWTENENRRYNNGPLVPPGTYTIELKVAGKSMKKTINLLADPRVLASGVSQSDMEEQFRINQEVIDLLSEARKLLFEIKKAHKELSIKEKKEKIDTDRIEVLQAMIALLETEEGTYMQPMLIDQIEYLYGITNGPDQAIGNDAKLRLDELRSQLGQLKEMNN